MSVSGRKKNNMRAIFSSTFAVTSQRDPAMLRFISRSAQRGGRDLGCGLGLEN